MRIVGLCKEVDGIWHATISNGKINLQWPILKFMPLIAVQVKGKKKLIIKWKHKHNRPMIQVWQAVNFNFFINFF